MSKDSRVKPLPAYTGSDEIASLLMPSVSTFQVAPVLTHGQLADTVQARPEGVYYIRSSPRSLCRLDLTTGTSEPVIEAGGKNCFVVTEQFIAYGDSEQKVVMRESPDQQVSLRLGYTTTLRACRGQPGSKMPDLLVTGNSNTAHCVRLKMVNGYLSATENTIEGIKAAAHDIVSSPDDKLLAVVSGSDEAAIFTRDRNTNTITLRNRFPVGGYAIRATWDSSSTYLAVAIQSFRAAIFDAQTGKAVFEHKMFTPCRSVHRTTVGERDLFLFACDQEVLLARLHPNFPSLEPDWMEMGTAALQDKSVVVGASFTTVPQPGFVLGFNGTELAWFRFWSMWEVERHATMPRRFRHFVRLMHLLNARLWNLPADVLWIALQSTPVLVW